MGAGVLARETLVDHGELRAYLLEERAELLIEVLRDVDGRAWQLRLPLDRRTTVAGLLRTTAPSLAAAKGLTFDADGTVILGEVPLGSEDGLTAVALAEGDERAFALWRRERLRSGWSWTIDLVLVPIEFGQQLCRFVQSTLSAAREAAA